ncbi:PQQ-dependent sugar dehydrogenase [soil metagenome]
MRILDPIGLKFPIDRSRRDHVPETPEVELTVSRRPSLLVGLIVASAGAGSVGAAGAETAPPARSPATPSATLTLVAPADVAVDLAWREGDDSLYVAQQGGVIVRVAPDGSSTTTFDIASGVKFLQEQGLLGLAFSPSGKTAFVNYTDLEGHSVIIEVPVTDSGEFLADEMRTVLKIEQPYDNHNCGDLTFGPDEMLYIGMGDGGSGGDPENRAQDLSSLLGKMLRIDPTPSGELGYTIPPDNPFVDVDGARGEIWSLGLRNPWRFSFDPVTGDLWIADVGQSLIEEVNVATAVDGLDAGRGTNFGWAGFEGNDVFNEGIEVADHHPPSSTYGHDNGRCSISGGTRARGEASGPFDGWYLYADYCSSEIFAVEVIGDGADIVAGSTALIATARFPPAVVSGPDGAIYVLDTAGVNRLE